MKIITNLFSDRMDNSKFNHMLESIVGKQVVRFLDTDYKLATYVFSTRANLDNNVMLIVNTMSGELLAISVEEFDAIKNNTLKELNPFLYDYLVQQWFLIPKYTDEQTLIDTIRNAKMSNFRLTDPLKVNKFIILTTMDCNARCYYCYENGCDRKETMTPEKANEVADFIIKSVKNTFSGLDEKTSKKKVNQFQITWFGGEPTLNFEAIRIIVDKLNAEGLPFNNYGISNGYLLNEENVKYLSEVAHCKRFQITLDGLNEEYAKVKNYIYDDPDPFSTIEKNMRCCINHGIDISIRLNLGLHNYDSMVQVVKWFFEKFVPTLTEEQKHMVGIYSHALFSCSAGGSTNQEELDELYTKEMELVKLMHSYTYVDGKYTDYLIHQYNIRKIGGLKYSACALTNENSIVINPDGSISKCEHSLKESMIGSIDDYYLDMDLSAQASWLSFRDRSERCKTCPYYASCATARNCYGSEICSPKFVEYVNYLSEFHMNMMYDKEMKSAVNSISDYVWLVDNYNESTRDLGELNVINIDDKDVYVLNNLHIHSNNYIVTMPVDSKQIDVRIYKYTLSEDGALDVYDMDSLEESLVIHDMAHRITDSGLIMKIINSNNRERTDV